MKREDLIDLNVFLIVAEERSFTRAAAKLGSSQSALSHAMRRLEARLGVRLLSRTTRSVAPTQAGERLLQTIGPALGLIDDELSSIGELRDRPFGTIRITAPEHAAATVLWPKVCELMQTHPDLNVELNVDAGLRDIVSDRFDAGVRLGEQVARDMIAVRIGPDLSMAAVAAPDYFESRPRPKTPQQLADHQCINLRFVTAGGLYAWELEKHGRELHVRVEGQFTSNNPQMILRAACAGVGIAFLPEDYARLDIAAGRLVRVLEDWCPPFPGYHLYYPSRRQPTAAFSVVLDALRYREPSRTKPPA